jgi:hypothetical protein
MEGRDRLPVGDYIAVGQTGYPLVMGVGGQAGGHTGGLEDMQ